MSHLKNGKKKLILKLERLDLCTMTTSMDTNIDNTSHLRKTVIINNKFLRLKVDVATLQETRLTGQGSIRENEFTFIWNVKSVEKRREQNVVFTFKNTLFQTV